ncbi:MAG TPA: TIM barrel protein [Candidatus Elarobacter sp.]|nr:TIM barrel protein [Candidatus Elarobacter sp.]
MKFGVSASIRAAEPADETLARLERIARWRFDGVELHVHDPLDLDAIRIVRHQLTHLGLEATVAGIAEPSVPFERHVRDLVDACALLDAHVLCGPLASAEDRLGVAMLAGVTTYAAERGVTIALGGRDDSADASALTLAETCRLVDAVGDPNLGVLYNTYQAHIAESSISSAILAAGARLRHVQIAENDDAIPGTGQVGWSETFVALDAIRYDGWYVIDARHDERVEAIALGGLRFLRRHRSVVAPV